MYILHSVIYNLRRKQKSMLDGVFDKLTQGCVWYGAGGSAKAKSKQTQEFTEHAATLYAQPFKELSNLDD